LRTYLASLLLLAATTGCKKDDPLFCTKNPGASGCPMPDGEVIVGEDADIDMGPPADARLCYGTATFSFCLTGPAQSPLMFMNASAFDTSPNASLSPACLSAQPTDWTTTNNNPDACFLVGTSITIDGALSVSGSRPLVLVSASTITINANLDGASHRDGTDSTGPGAPFSGCPSYTVMPAGAGNGGGGGAGGSFMKLGGVGGTGDMTGNAGGAPTTGAGTNPFVLRAGCNGQAGAGNNSGSTGKGGGAIYLVASDSITVATGVMINVSGGGGGLPGRDDGGSGGGAGGMLLLDAPVINSTGAFFFANGGGGSSGATNTGSGSATDGLDPASATAGGVGGPAPNGAGSGGTGWKHADTAGGAGMPSTTAQFGGGGGGGGGGWIQANVATGATSSPPVFVP